MVNWNKWDPACVDDSEDLPDQSYVMGPNYNYEKLRAENAKLRECVEFYADKKSYVPRRSNSDIYSCIVGDNTIDKNRIAHAGKYARQVLKELGGKMNDTNLDDNIQKLLSKINLALFIMKDNEWHNDEGSIEYQVYKILEKAILLGDK